MEHKDIAEKIIELKDADLALRDQLIQNGQLGDGYNEAMKQLHNKNAALLNEIIDTIGYPTIEKVGPTASEAAWLVIQHSIERPAFMKKCAELLKQIDTDDNAVHRNLAYLTDRIAAFEGMPQLYGTQFDWDENGALSPNPVDDLNKVNQRRKSIGLNTLEEQTVIIRERAKREGERPPKDFNQRKNEIEEWRRKVGWIK